MHNYSNDKKQKKLMTQTATLKTKSDNDRCVSTGMRVKVGTLFHWCSSHRQTDISKQFRFGVVVTYTKLYSCKQQGNTYYASTLKNQLE